MCGICGIYDLSGQNSTEFLTKQVQTMVTSLAHRGPDASGIHIDAGLVLGATRLSIIDLSEAANPPISDETGDYTLVLSGEVYNYLELREQMRAKGISFQTDGDSEVLLRLFMQKKWACLDELRGMFAFAVWQQSTRCLYLARDRMGEKPLVYYYRNGLLIFASEIRCLLALDTIDRTIDPAGLHLGFHFVLPPAPYSAFKHIRKLPPGCHLSVSEMGLKQTRYFLPIVYTSKVIREKDAVEQLQFQMDETVRMLCRSDVSVGATLSGGMDSSAVVSAMTRTIDSFDVFYVGAKNSALNVECLGAKEVAKQYGLKLHEIYIGPEIFEQLRDIVRAYAEPFSSFVPLHAHALASTMKNYASVILTGSGGDELFGGYPQHSKFLKIDRKLALWMSVNRWGLDAILRYLPFSSIISSKKKYDELDCIPLNQLAANITFKPFRGIPSCYYSDLMSTMIKDIQPDIMMAEVFDDSGAHTLLDGFFSQQLSLLNQHSLVTIPDISGMSHSVEFRSPFLEREMVALASAIDWNLKVKLKHRDAGRKWILRQAMRRRLPDQVTRLEKHGFGSSIPYHKWFTGPWLPFITEILNSRSLIECGLFNHKSLLNALNNAAAGHGVFFEFLWGMVTLAIWLEEYG